MYTETMTLQEMKKRKKELHLTNEKIAELTGVPLGTVQKVFAGITKTPRWATRAALQTLLCTYTPSDRPPETAESILAEIHAFDAAHPKPSREISRYRRPALSDTGSARESAAP